MGFWILESQGMRFRNPWTGDLCLSMKTWATSRLRDQTSLRHAPKFLVAPP